MGGGIWSMHFVAMLAFSMPGMEFGYDLGLTLLSLAVAILATGASFTMMNRAYRSWLMLAAAGLLMGLGVVAMHYIGMSAMQMSSSISYDGLWLSISVLIAIGAATTALWIASRESSQLQRLAAACLMGVAVAGMHYAGMRAAIFTVAPGTDMAEGSASIGQTALAMSVSAATFLILFLALMAAMFDRRFAVMAEREADALRASEERFRSLYQDTPLPLHSLNEDGCIEQVSNTWLSLMGYSRDEVEGRPLINFLTEASARQFRQQDLPELIAKEVLPPRDYRAVTKSGKFLDVVAAAKVERDAEGNFLHVLGGLTDVTDRKRVEDALRQSQKIEALGQLTGGIAHDFNNLLAVIVGNLDLLRRRLPADDLKANRLVESALEGAQRGASLTQRLLTFARRQDLRPSAVEIPGLIRGMADLLQRTIGPQIRVDTQFPLHLPQARVDANQLEMAILNLAVNARDAMPAGGSLKISADEPVLPSGVNDDLRPGRYIRLTVSDDGEGMNDETLARATDPFFTTKGVGKGTGLGLSMVHGLAAQSGGRLHLRSCPGKGTTAELYLPVATKEAEDRTVVTKSEPIAIEVSSRSLTVMVVDDDPLVLDNTSAMLQELGHVVLTASSANDALIKLNSKPKLDVLITDHLMPGKTGLELIKEVGEHLPGMRTLLISGFADLDPSELQGVLLLRKPFSLRELTSALQRVSSSAPIIPFARRART
nr:MHYT domain-containing protein [Sphingomonas xinjiangensis]